MMRDRLAAQRARRQQARGAAVREIDLPLPLRGIFAKAKSAQVSNLHASELFNMRSNGVSITLRPGVVWDGPKANLVLQRIPFEFSGRSIWIEMTAIKVSAGTAALFRDFNGRANWATNSGNVIIADGEGAPIRFDGTAFSEAAFTATAGPDPAECDGIISHHDRIYLWKTGGDLEFLVGDVGAVQGAMSRFPLGRLGNITGSILTMVSLTIDAGHGMNDVLCIITTTGHLIIYEGFDPTDASDWRLSARIKAAAPVSTKAITQVGADAWMLTAQGPVSIGQSVRESVLALVSEVSQPISDEITALIEAGAADWQMVTADDGTMVVINLAAGGAASQFVYYTESRSWATANFPARQWHSLGGSLRFSGFDGKIASLRHTGSAELITGRWVSSWFQAGSGGRVAYVQPTIIAEGPLDVRVVVLSDNNDTPADIAEAEQTLRIEPEEGGASRVTLSDIIPTDASGRSFQITLEVTAKWAEITGLTAGIGS